MKETTGQCMCGAVKYQVSGNVIGISCHCKECQQLHGNYNPMLVADKENFSLTEDKGIAWYDSSDEKRRGFCKVCGSALLMEQTTGPKMLISVGSLDNTEVFKNVKNVWAEQAGHYYVIPPEEGE